MMAQTNTGNTTPMNSIECISKTLNWLVVRLCVHLAMHHTYKLDDQPLCLDDDEQMYQSE